MYGKDNFTWFLREKMETITVAHQKFGEEKKKKRKMQTKTELYPISFW